MFDDIESIHRFQVYALVLGALTFALGTATATAVWAVLKYSAVA